MKQIYKYPIHRYPMFIFGSQTLMLPRDAKIIHVDHQLDSICIWAIIDTEETRMEPRIIEVYGTGQVISSELGHIQHLGTVIMQRLGLIWHVFENTMETVRAIKAMEDSNKDNTNG